MKYPPIIQIRRKRATLYGRFVLFRAKSDGGPILKTEPSRIRDINGFMLTFGPFNREIDFTKKPEFIQFVVVFRRRLKV